MIGPDDPTLYVYSSLPLLKSMVTTAERLEADAEYQRWLCGLKFEDTLLLREKRTGTSIIQSSVRADTAATKTALYESAIVLRR